MRAAVRRRYCSPDDLRIEDVPKPEVTDDGVLVRVRAASVNRADWYGMTGTPYVARGMTGLLKPKSKFFGTDFAGTVEAVGKDVSDFRPGDDVFGGKTGAFAEYVNVRDAVVPKPANVSFEEAAAVPVAALTALQGLRDRARLQPGQRVLVNGASGGVGTFAVQIAKALGAEVTAVCRTRNVDQARAIGADHVIDYTREDFTQGAQRYDLIFELAGSHSPSDIGRALTSKGTLILIGHGESKGRWIGPMVG
jgi:NADPH:quinone reductase-like Zn-dependent oxidoreductase